MRWLRPLTLTLTLTLTLSACALLRPPQTIVQVDTVTVTKEVPPPLPTGDSAEICLATGMPARVLIASNGDTLIGEARVRLRDVRPVLSFSGTYAREQSWYQVSDTLRFEKRPYRRTGAERARACDELKLVGAYAGVSVFAEVTAPNALPMVFLPVRPGIFQMYTTVSSATGSQRRRR